MKVLSYSFDKVQKLLYLSLSILSIFVVFYVNSLLIDYGSSISPDINVYSSMPLAIAILTSFTFGVSFLFFVNKLEKSKYNNFKLEKYLSNFFKKIKIIEVNNKAYYLFIFFYFSFFFYSSIESIVLMAADASLKTGIDYITFEKTKYFNYDYIRSLFLIGMSFLFFITFLIIKPKQQNKDFLFGLMIIPIILNISNMVFLSNIWFSSDDLDIGASLNTEFKNLLVQLDYQYGFASKIFYGFLAFTLIYYVYRVFKSKKKIKNTILHLIGGLSVYKLSAVTGSFLFVFSPTLDYFNSNEDIKTVSIHGKDYTINQTLLSTDINEIETEFLIESYAGLSMHNSVRSLEGLLSVNFEGDKEKSIKFASDLLLTNLEKYNQKEDKLVHLLKTEKIDLSSIVNILIPYIIYEAAPLEDQERSLKAILAGDYQNGIDYFIEDSLNRTEVRTLPLTMSDKESQTMTHTYGHMTMQNILALIEHEGLAKIDYEKIKDNEVREKFKTIMTDSLISRDGTSMETANKWFEMFNTNRLL